mmetsp:Transcript_52488/g.111505  ORF Transcript_52488/g.111505 Transcript_52488/m.111505 type:complete len:237 (-) Transcript_52488:1559-2269(-)
MSGEGPLPLPPPPLQTSYLRPDRGLQINMSSSPTNKMPSFFSPHRHHRHRGDEGRSPSSRWRRLQNLLRNFRNACCEQPLGGNPLLLRAHRPQRPLPPRGRGRCAVRIHVRNVPRRHHQDADADEAGGRVSRERTFQRCRGELGRPGSLRGANIRLLRNLQAIPPKPVPPRQACLPLRHRRHDGRHHGQRLAVSLGGNETVAAGGDLSEHGSGDEGDLGKEWSGRILSGVYGSFGT